MADIEDLVSGEIKKGTNIQLNCGGPVMAVHSVEKMLVSQMGGSTVSGLLEKS